MNDWYRFNLLSNSHLDLFQRKKKKIAGMNDVYLLLAFVLKEVSSEIVFRISRFI